MWCFFELLASSFFFLLFARLLVYFRLEVIYVGIIPTGNPLCNIYSIHVYYNAPKITLLLFSCPAQLIVLVLVVH